MRLPGRLRSETQKNGVRGSGIDGPHQASSIRASYIDFGHAMLERDRTVAAIPSWLILDVRHRRRYLFNAFLQGTKQLRAKGIVRSAATIEELATGLGMQPTRLRATVERFNDFARTGVDADFGRGRTAYDNYYGDPGAVAEDDRRGDRRALSLIHI